MKKAAPFSTKFSTDFLDKPRRYFYRYVGVDAHGEGHLIDVENLKWKAREDAEAAARHHLGPNAVYLNDPFRASNAAFDWPLKGAGPYQPERAAEYIAAMGGWKRRKDGRLKLLSYSASSPMTSAFPSLTFFPVLQGQDGEFATTAFGWNARFGLNPNSLFAHVRWDENNDEKIIVVIEIKGDLIRPEDVDVEEMRRRLFRMSFSRYDDRGYVQLPESSWRQAKVEFVKK